MVSLIITGIVSLLVGGGLVVYLSRPRMERAAKRSRARALLKRSVPPVARGGRDAAG